ncbi:hypothetical protein AJ79_10252 [Helicocarpus griseus UAMH5409]|uniref:Uncharacterized protein n=1 Tax=Helicocarpus griseus UAMH5409 TaxID=1447875 RepID=A0A2B7WEU8_9EURO|nr:hypothetical protein AJ79_10252 [Helicocarpus griseus UAMH5409]
MAYDRDEFIRLLTDYYNFCSRVFWDVPVAQAPAGGWPSINQETLAKLKRSDTVIDLLRNMPYIDYPGDSEHGYVREPLIMDNTYTVEYRREHIQKLIREGNIEGVAAPYTGQGAAIPPSSCAVIAVSRGRNGYHIILDTTDGYIYWGDPNGQHDEPWPELNSTLKQFEGDESNEWRQYGFNVYEPADFFALCKERFRELSWIGRQEDEMSVQRQGMGWEYESEPDSWSDSGDHISHNKLARKMKKAGWPGDGEGRGWDRAKFDMLLRGEYCLLCSEGFETSDDNEFAWLGYYQPLQLEQGSSELPKPRLYQPSVRVNIPRTHAACWTVVVCVLEHRGQSIDREWLSRFCRYLKHLTSSLPTMRHVSEPIFPQEGLFHIRDSDAESFAALHVEGNVGGQRKIGLPLPVDIIHLIYGLLDYGDRDSLQYATGVSPSPALWLERGRMYRDFKDSEYMTGMRTTHNLVGHIQRAFWNIHHHPDEFQHAVNYKLLWENVEKVFSYM